MDYFDEYILNNAVPVTNESINYRNMYLNVMETSIAAYDFNDIDEKINFPIYDFQDIFMGYSRIGMTRLLSVMAFLMKEGMLKEVDDFWARLMNAVLDDILKEHLKSGVEFLILEVCTALYVLGPDIDYYSVYIEKLKTINPYDQYDSTLMKKPKEELYNFCMYGICAEYLRGLLTGEDTDDFIQKHWDVQKSRFNSDGRYMDPGCPMVYDITSRYRLALMLGLGYKGSVSGEMKEVLTKGSYNLLFQMSSDYKFPYGGRSNQFNFNECLAASMFEFYSTGFFKRGDPVTAGVFRYNAVKSVDGLSQWLNAKPARHIKNMYPIGSSYGIDSYGTYERYMGTMGTFLSGAVLFMNESIPLYKIPDSIGSYVLSEQNEFHKIFASAGGYSVEIDPAADSKYDSSGLGRLHFQEAPAELALSMPFASSPKYLLGKFSNDKARSLCPYWTFEGNREYLSESKYSYKVKHVVETLGQVAFTVEYSIKNRGKINEEYNIDDSGVLIQCSSDYADISYCVPVFQSNGMDESVILHDEKDCSITLGGWAYKVVWTDSVKSEFRDYLLYNRNGVYSELNLVNKKKTIKIKLTIKRREE